MKPADSLRCGFFRTVVKLEQDATLPLEAVGPIDAFHRRETSSRILLRAAAVGQRYAAVRWI
jgi:hypothetical protein